MLSEQARIERWSASTFGDRSRLWVAPTIGRGAHRTYCHAFSDDKPIDSGIWSTDSRLRNTQ